MIRRTICCLCLSLTLGLLYGRKWEWQFLFMFLCLLAVMAAVISRLREHAGCVICVRVTLCVCLFCTGAAHMQKQQSVRNMLEAVLCEGSGIIVEGKVSRIGETQTFQGKQQFIYYLTDTRVFSGGNTYPSYGILIYSSNGTYQPGNILRVTGRYMPFQISRNEGNFNEKQYQQSRKWEFKVYAESEMQVSARKNQYMIFLGELRKNMQEVFKNSMDSKDAGVMANIALGEKSLMEPEIKELYQDAGISHILAISGLHVSLVGMGLLSLLQRLGCPRKWGALLSAGVVFSFGIFSGMEVSTGRAVCMFALMMAAQVLGRSYDSLTALAFCAMIQLWGNPFLLEYAGFLFSYSAVFGVVVIWKTIQDCGKNQDVPEIQKKSVFQKQGGLLQKGFRKMRDMLCVSACIQLATLPLSLYFYCEIPPYSILTNACILPFMGILLFLGIAGGILGNISPILGTVVLQPAGRLLAFNESVCRIFQKFPGAEFITGKPPIGLVLAYYAILAACLYLIWCRKKKFYLMGIFLALACLLLVRGDSRFEIDVLDVGQGDGIFIQNENGEHFFVDGGSSNVKEVGKYRILPFLKARGIRSVKGWIVSHADADHISGLLELLQEGYSVEYLILAEHMVRDDAMESLLQEAKAAGCEILYVSLGMEFGSGELVFTVLAPEENAVAEGIRGTADGSADRNASSLSLFLECRGFTGILTGDIGTEQEKKLLESDYLAQYGIEDVDFYKAAHHGSNHSNSQELLEALSPRMTVISCAEKNSYGHPGSEAVKRLNDAGSRIFLTMECGQIRIQPEEGDVRVWTYLP